MVFGCAFAAPLKGRSYFPRSWCRLTGGQSVPDELENLTLDGGWLHLLAKWLTFEIHSVND
jgi:hypothetical protein